MPNIDRLRQGYQTAANALLGEVSPAGHWEGELSSSPLSTATAIAALQLACRAKPERAAELQPLIDFCMQNTDTKRELILAKPLFHIGPRQRVQRVFYDPSYL